MWSGIFRIAPNNGVVLGWKVMSRRQSVKVETRQWLALLRQGLVVTAIVEIIRMNECGS
jgi:hypothetical protein